MHPLLKKSWIRPCLCKIYFFSLLNVIISQKKKGIQLFFIHTSSYVLSSFTQNFALSKLDLSVRSVEIMEKKWNNNIYCNPQKYVITNIYFFSVISSSDQSPFNFLIIKRDFLGNIFFSGSLLQYQESRTGLLYKLFLLSFNF